MLGWSRAGEPGRKSGWLQHEPIGLARAERSANLVPRPVATNPLHVPSAEFEHLWNKTVAVVDKYFDIESENRLARTIKTQPQMGATVLEPWAFDSVKIQDRIEASLQTIKRAAIIHIDPGLPADSW